MIVLLLLVPALILALYGWVLLVRRVVSPSIDADVTCSPSSIAHGSEAEIVVAIRNTSRLPCPFVSCEFELPTGLSAAGVATEKALYTVRLGPREAVKIRVKVKGTKRGRHHIHYAALYISDGFTMHRETKELHPFLTVTVHPRRVSAMPVLARLDRLGLLSSNRKLAPTSVDWVDMREYQHGDPMRDIAWAASARLGRLIVLERALAMNQEIVLVASVRVSNIMWETSASHADQVYEISYGMMETLTRNGYQFSFFSDALWPDVRRRAHNRWILRGNGVWSKREQRRIGHVLGTMAVSCATTLADTLAQVEKEVRGPAHIILVTGYLDSVSKRRIEEMQRRGHDINTVWLMPQLASGNGRTEVNAP